ncbi:MAG: hypothetical protein V4649_19575 [Bacteroidota bacterium]
MPSIRITQFAGLVPEITGRNIPAVSAQVAHNCLLSNGTLRPQAKWVQLESYVPPSGEIRSISYDRATGRAVMYASHDAITMEGAPFVSNTTLGAALAPAVVAHVTGVPLTYVDVGIESTGVTGSVSYTRAYLSNKPVNRLYAVSRVRTKFDRTEEGPLACLIGSPDTIVYEGDTANISLSVQSLSDGVTHIRLYRSISGLDTGQEIANTLDTGWFLIDTIAVPAGGSINYIDGGSVTTDYMDAYYAGQFHAPTLLAKFFGLAESGWFTAIASNGDIAISERYLHHAWPVENTLKLHETVNDAVVHMDNIYVGTNRRPYLIPLQMGEKALMSNPVPFPEPYKCLPGSMTVAPSGAIYASNIGLIGLSREGQRVLTASIANAGDILYSRVFDGITTIASIDTTTFGAYHNGWYYGFCGGTPSDTFF